MSAPAGAVARGCPRPVVSVGLIGCGQVGTALLQLLPRINRHDLRLLALCNSRVMRIESAGLSPVQGAALLAGHREATDVDRFAAAFYERAAGTAVLVDATGSRDVAQRHGRWLASGANVVTANKLPANASLAEVNLPGYYGDAATVGAGLPVLHAVRRLRAAGERIHRIEGVLSGSLAYIFHALQGGDDFSTAVMRAQRRGLTEPNPCTDLSGADVACKLAVIARAAGLSEVKLPAPESLLPADWHALSQVDLRRALTGLDAVWRERAEAARAGGCVLRYIAAIGAEGSAEVGLRRVSCRDPLATTSGADNLVAIYSESYARDPLVIRGPGAGPAVTARAMLADLATAVAVARLANPGP